MLVASELLAAMSVHGKKWMERVIANLTLSKYARDSWRYVRFQNTRTMAWRRIVAAKWAQLGPASIATLATSKMSW